MTLLDNMVMWFIGIIVELLDVLVTGVLSLLRVDIAFFMGLFPIAQTSHSGFRIMAFSLITLFSIWGMLKTMLTPNPSEAESPIQLLFRAALFTFLAANSLNLINTLLNYANTPFEWIMGLGSDEASMSLFGHSHNVVSAGFSGLTAALIGPIIAVVFVIVVGWNTFKAIVQCVANYLTIGLLAITSPLAFSMGVLQSTTPVLKAWVRMIGGQVLLLIMNVWMLRMLITLFQRFLTDPAMIAIAASIDADMSGILTEAGQNVSDSISGSAVGGIPMMAWMFIIVAWIKVMQSLPGVINQLGLNIAQTGGQVFSTMMIAAMALKGIKLASAGKSSAAGSGGKGSSGGKSSGSGGPAPIGGGGPKGKTPPGGGTDGDAAGKDSGTGSGKGPGTGPGSDTGKGPKPHSSESSTSGGKKPGADSDTRAKTGAKAAPGTEGSGEFKEIVPPKDGVEAPPLHSEEFKDVVPPGEGIDTPPQHSGDFKEVVPPTDYSSHTDGAATSPDSTSAPTTENKDATSSAAAQPATHTGDTATTPSPVTPKAGSDTPESKVTGTPSSGSPVGSTGDAKTLQPISPSGGSNTATDAKPTPSTPMPKGTPASDNAAAPGSNVTVGGSTANIDASGNASQASQTQAPTGDAPVTAPSPSEASETSPNPAVGSSTTDTNVQSSTATHTGDPGMPASSPTESTHVVTDNPSGSSENVSPISDGISTEHGGTAAGTVTAPNPVQDVHGTAPQAINSSDQPGREPPMDRAHTPMNSDKPKPVTPSSSTTTTPSTPHTPSGTSPTARVATPVSPVSPNPQPPQATSGASQGRNKQNPTRLDSSTTPPKPPSTRGPGSSRTKGRRKK